MTTPDTHTEWGVRYMAKKPDPGHSPVRFLKVHTEGYARLAVKHGIPHSGYQHTVVRREVTDWEEA